MPPTRDSPHALRAGILGAALTLIGTLLSGPLGVVLVAAVNPTPGWQGPRAFAAYYHPIQTFPYFAGFALVTGALVLMAALYRLAEEGEKTALLVANGVVSIMGGFVTATSLGWVYSTAGLVSYALWNVLVVALTIMIILALRRRERETRGNS
jgi:hypothetical protein